MPSADTPPGAAASFDWRVAATWLPGHVARVLLGVVVAVGIAVRVVVWWQARSFFIDETNLLRNFAERDYAGLLRPLQYEQYAPPLLSAALKAATGLLGYGERAARVVPLLASLLALVVLAYVARRWLTPLGAVLATAFVALGAVYIELATTAKQYSTDLLVAVALLALADRQLRQPRFTTRAALAWAVGGAGVVWGSMPAVFGLAGVGAALAWQYGRRSPGQRAAWARLLLVGAAWSISFGTYFLLLLRADAQASNLQLYHRAYFLAFPPLTAADWALLGQQLHGLVDRAFGKTGLALGLAVLGVGVGGARLARHQPLRLLLLAVPLVLALAASALHYYSLIARLMVFTMPALVVLIISGLEPAFRARGVGVVVAGLLVATLANQQRLVSLFKQPFLVDYADVRAGLRYISAHRQPGELAFVYHNAASVAYYYQRLAPLHPPLGATWLQKYRLVPGEDSALVAADVGALVRAGHRRLWFVYDDNRPWLRRWAAATGHVSQDTAFHRGYAFRWEAR